VESGRLVPEVEAVDLAEVLGDLRGTLRPLVPAGVALELDLPAEMDPEMDPQMAPDLVEVETDRGLLVHVLRNLLTNALAFTERGAVRLTVRRLSPVEIAIDVADTGVGIAPEDQERVFEEFFQVKGPLQNRRRGSGLGLPYARRVVHALGGDLTLSSRPGEGSTFTVSLPVRWVASLAQEVSPPGGRESLDVDLDVGLVLLVDDDEGFRRILRGMLQGMAGQIVEAGSGQEGLDRMEALTPDVVFLDLRMPDMDGAEVLTRMEQRPELHDVPVVIVSSVDLSGPGLPGLGRSAAVLAKATLDRPLLQATLAEVLTRTERP
jgi:CheY-like chemotaxis protein